MGCLLKEVPGIEHRQGKREAIWATSKVIWVDLPKPFGENIRISCVPYAAYGAIGLDYSAGFHTWFGPIPSFRMKMFTLCLYI